MAADAPHPAFEGYAAEAVPQAPVGAPGKDGRLELAFAVDDESTYLARDFARVPFHLSGTLDHDPHPDAATVYVQSPTGGVAQGDRHAVAVTVGSDAVAHVSTGSSTKVLSMERNYAAVEGSLSVDAGGHLEYVPEPVILHADARYCQDFTLDVAPGGTAVVADVVASGRLARGERFDFERYVSQLRVRSAGTLLFEDATHLHPDATDPAVPGVVDEFAVYGSSYVVAPDATTGVAPDELADDVYDAVADTEARAAATTLPNDAGVVVRALGHRAETVTDALHAAWDVARRERLGVGAPDGRKL